MSAKREPDCHEPQAREPAGRDQAGRGGQGREPLGAGLPAGPDYAQLDDAALISLRWQVREQLEREPANMADLVRAYHLMTVEVLRRTAAVRKQGPGQPAE